MIQKTLADQLRKYINRKIGFPAIIFTPETFGQVGVVVLFFIRLVLIEAICHFEIVIPGHFNLLLGAIRNAF